MKKVSSYITKKKAKIKGKVKKDLFKDKNKSTKIKISKEQKEDWQKYDHMNLEELQQAAHTAKRNKEIKKIQKRINKLVNPHITDINKVLDYDRLKDLPWLNKNRPQKYWKTDRKVKMGKKEKEFIHKRVKELENLSFVKEIEEKDAKHILPFFTVPKPGNEFREIMDFSYLNTFVKNVSANVPGYPEICEAQQGSKYRAKIDMTKAYQRIILDEKIRPYCCFIVEGKCYQWKRMPFGLNIAPAVYQIFIQRLIKKQDKALNYLDDIKIWGKNKEEVKHIVGELIRVLEKNNIIINYKKSELEPIEEMEFLGYLWNKGKMYNKPKKIEKAYKWLRILRKNPTKHSITKALGDLEFISIAKDSMQSLRGLQKEVGSLDKPSKLKEKLKVNNEYLEAYEKIVKDAEIKEIIKYNKMHTLERGALIKDKDIERIYVDSSPYATGIFCANSHKLYKLEFPKEVQRFTSAASVKEHLGYILTNELMKRIYKDKKYLLVGDNQGIIKNITTGKTRFWRNKSQEIQIIWTSNKDRLLDIADIISREYSNNELRLERSQQYKIIDKEIFKKVKLDLVNKELRAKIEGKEIKVNIESMMNELVPMKGIEWLRKDERSQGKKIYLRDKLAKILETKNSGFEGRRKDRAIYLPISKTLKPKFKDRKKNA